MKPKITEEQAHELYDDMLDDLYPVQIGTLNYCGSIALYRLDPIAYDCGFTEYLDVLAEDYDISEFY